MNKELERLVVVVRRPDRHRSPEATAKRNIKAHPQCPSSGVYHVLIEGYTNAATPHTP